MREYQDKLIRALTDISNMCVGELAMGYRLDAQTIGEIIHEATGMTNPELNAYYLTTKLTESMPSSSTEEDAEHY